MLGQGVPTKCYPARSVVVVDSYRSRSPLEYNHYAAVFALLEAFQKLQGCVFNILV